MSEHELWNELGNLYFMSGAYKQAIHAYERSIQADSSFGRPYSNLALTYVQQGRYEDAIELYRRSIELLADNKEKAISWNRLGTVYRHLKDYSRAVIAFQEADELDPHTTDDFPAVAEVRGAAGPAPSSVLDEPVRADAAILVSEPRVQEEPLVVEAGTDGLMLPLAEPNAIVPQAQASAVEPDESNVESDPPEVEWESPSATAEEGDPETEWWDVDEGRMQSATQGEPVAELPHEEANTSWTPADASQFQQSVSKIPETGSLTTWGDGSFDDDFEFFPSTGDSSQDVPDPDADKMATWIPIPEEAPINFDELWMPPFFEEGDPELEFAEEWPSEWNEAPSYHLLNSTDFGAAQPALSPVPQAVDVMERSEPMPVRQVPAQTIYDQLDVSDVAFEGLPVSAVSLTTVEVEQPVEFEAVAAITEPEVTLETVTEISEPGVELQPVPAIEPEPEAVAAIDEPEAELEPLAASYEPELETDPVAAIVEAQSEPAPAVSLNALPPDLPDAERDDEEMREIEMGIAKFRRVVQVNPRNAHAWDALGTLFKSAGLYRDAILAYQQAISNDSTKSLYYHHLGLVYACEGRDEDAISAFQRVIEIDPEYSLAHATLGGYYRKLGLQELAQKHIGKAMKNIFDSENEYNKACLQAICGNADQAIELLGVALKNKQTYVDWILRDPDLDFIRQDPRFKQLISDYTR